MSPGRWLGVAAAVLVLAVPAPALAHAGFVSSRPEPGSTLGSAPGVVELDFSEPLNRELSRATVTAPDGQRFAGFVAGDHGIRIPLSTNLQGVYRVEWTTVSTVDGHTLHGSFGFGVGVAPGPAAEGVVSDEPNRLDLLIAVARTVEDLALLLAIGMLLVGRLARREPRLGWVRLRVRPVLLVALIGGTSVVIGEALLAASGASVGAVVAYLSTGSAGLLRLLRPVTEAGALALSFTAPGTVAAATTLSLVLLAGAGHAAAVPPAWWAIGVQAVHLVSAGLWAGGILALASQRPPDGWRGPSGRALLDRFSPVALAAFGLTAAAGALRGIQEVGSLGDLVASSYGLVLLAKVLGVGLLVQLSVLAWRRVLPVPRLEAGLAVLVIGAAAVLAAFPLPPARVTALDGAGREAPGETGLPGSGDLTLGDHAGQVLVGLTLRPGVPGPNTLLLFLLPLDGEEAATGLAAEVAVDGRPLTIRQCGSTCRRAMVDLEGGERVDVEVAGPIGGSAVFHLPELPAVGGGRVLERMLDRMHRLTSYRLEETLATGLTVVRATYTALAPDRMRIEVRQESGGSDTVWIGSVRYVRDLPDGDWSRREGGPPPRVPSFIWDFFRPLRDARIVGSEVVEGHPTRIVAFFGESGATPIWFRLWIDDTGLVHRAAMRAQGHFMDHRYSGFDSPVRIEPPQGALDARGRGRGPSPSLASSYATVGSGGPRTTPRRSTEDRCASRSPG